MSKKPRLSFWQIWNMSFGFLGIQFGFALQNANVSRIFETLGANVEDIPILWIAAPLTGLLIQPIIGHLSDRTWTKMGRRRPYFLAGAILSSLALLFMPNTPVLWMAAGTLWIMDASINVSMEPFRAFVGDMLPEEQRTSGFAMQSFFIGIGAVVGSALPWFLTNILEIENTAPPGVVPPSVKISFYAGAIVFLVAILVTIFSSKEYSPSQLKEFDGAGADHKNESNDNEINRSIFLKVGFVFSLIGAFVTYLTWQYSLEKELYILGGMLVFFGFSMFLVYLLKKKPGRRGMMVDVFSDLVTMPKTMKQLAVVQFFSWFALFAMWIYTTNAITSTKYDMKVDKEMIAYLETKLNSLDSSNAKINELNGAKKEISIIKSKLENSDEVSIPVNLAKFFLDDNILNERQVIDSLIVKESLIGTNDEQSKLVKKELEGLKKSKNPDVSYQTLMFFKEKEIEHSGFMASVDFAKYLRLKKINYEYNKGADWVGILFGTYNLFAAIFAFLLIWIARKTNRKITHATSLIIGGLSFISILFISSPQLLLISFIGIGLVWSSILSMPYAILTCHLPSNKMGVYMGIFNFFIVLPQILAATILGFMVKSLFHYEAVYALIVGGVSMIIAAVMVLFVDDK